MTAHIRFSASAILLKATARVAARAAAAVWLAVAGASSVPAAEKERSGEITYTPSANETGVPQRFRLDKHTFAYRQRTLSDDGERIVLSTVTFPSPVKTPHDNNNTVHCEYFRPAKVEASNGNDAGDPKTAGNSHNAKNGKKRPGVIVLHILGGDFPLSRTFCAGLANKNVAALFVKMPYYGERRQPNVAARMIAPDPRDTVEGMTQAILDIRRAAAWLAAQDDVDPERLGVFGISLGGITAALAATAEPRFTKVCPMLAGGDISQIALESPELAKVRAAWQAQGQSQREAYELLRAIDPVTYAENLRARKTKVLMINARRDEVIPRRCTDSLWQAFGQPRIVWYDAGHISSLRYLNSGLVEVSTFFSQ